MIQLEKYIKPLKEFLSSSIQSFREDFPTFKSIAITWNQDEEIIILSINPSKTIEESNANFKEFEIVEIAHIRLEGINTSNISETSSWAYNGEKHIWSENPYRTNLNYLFRRFITDCIIEIHSREDFEILSQFYSDNWKSEVPKRIFGSRNAQLGRFVIDNLRDNAFGTIQHYQLQSIDINESDKLKVNFLQSLTDEQRSGFNELMNEIIDNRILSFLCGVDESFSDEYDGIKFMIGETEMSNGETIEGGFMQEFFHWRQKYSKYQNFEK